MNLELFKNPPKEYRPIPFWSWNDRLQTDELKRQIGEMDRQGWGGFFMHSRIGLETPYMSEEWMRCVSTCIEEAAARGMGAWLYDEDKWPSGYAGGAVPRLGPDYREKALFVSENKIPYPPDEIKVLKVYEVVKENTKEAFSEFPSHSNQPGFTFKELKDVTEDYVSPDCSSCLSGKTGLLFFYCWTAPMKYPWFNGTSYVDLLNPKVTEAFIAATHEKYASRFAGGFGKTVPGIFTDEPGYLMYGGRFSGRRNVLPWSEVIADAFREEYGYDILEHLPELFYPLKGYEKIRFDYRKLVNKLFVRNYSKKVYEWCEAHGLKYTGHYLAEDPITMSLERCGSLMQHYVYMHYPGIDHLKRTTADDIVTQRQLQSVVNQFGKERALCETFGCAGQDFSFEGQKWIANWNFVNGVNIINPHLSLYSMRGVRKRDFPPNLFYQQPWWEYNHICASYLTRLSYMLSQGRRIVDILVIHPIESGFILFSPMDKSKTNKLHAGFERTLWTLMENHFDFDLGDEEILEEYGTVAEGSFKVGISKYEAVVLPPMMTLRENTLMLLKTFIAEGGQVFVLKDYPTHVEGVPDAERIKECLEGSIPVTYYNLVQAVRNQLEPQVEIQLENGCPAKKIFYHKRVWDGDLVYFFCNNDTSTGYKVKIALREQGKANILDPLTGDVTECKSKVENGRTSFEYYFEPSGSLLIHVKTSSKEHNAAGPDGNREITAECGVETGKLSTMCTGNTGPDMHIPVCGPWELEVAEKNVLVLDYCQYDLYGSGYGSRVPCIQAYEDIKDREVSSGKLRLRYSFMVEGWDGHDGELVMERPEDFHISLNGKTLEFRDTGYWKDISFRRTAISDYIVQGENTVELTYCGKEKVEVESIYILGDFKVKMAHQRFISLVPSSGKAFLENNAVAEGYPFYAGKVKILKEIDLDVTGIQRCLLRFDALNAIAATVWVNGCKAGDIIWRPYEIDITPYVRSGKNRIEIEMVNSLHNLLGPHHDVRGEVLPFVGPEQFNDKGNWTDTYYLRPFGVSEVNLALWLFPNVKP
jgi:hypothetical protein